MSNPNHYVKDGGVFRSFKNYPVEFEEYIKEDMQDRCDGDIRDMEFFIEETNDGYSVMINYEKRANYNEMYNETSNSLFNKAIANYVAYVYYPKYSEEA